MRSTYTHLDSCRILRNRFQNMFSDNKVLQPPWVGNIVIHVACHYIAPISFSDLSCNIFLSEWLTALQITSTTSQIVQDLRRDISQADMWCVRLLLRTLPPDIVLSNFANVIHCDRKKEFRVVYRLRIRQQVEALTPPPGPINYLQLSRYFSQITTRYWTQNIKVVFSSNYQGVIRAMSEPSAWAFWLAWRHVLGIIRDFADPARHNYKLQVTMLFRVNGWHLNIMETSDTDVDGVQSKCEKHEGIPELLRKIEMICPAQQRADFDHCHNICNKGVKNKRNSIGGKGVWCGD